MNTDKLIDILAEIARENCKKFINDGGMLTIRFGYNENFSFNNNQGNIFEIFPFKEDRELYGICGLLSFYANEDGENMRDIREIKSLPDTKYEFLSDNDIAILIETLEKELGLKAGTIMARLEPNKTSKLVNYIKNDLTLEEMVIIINAWEKWRDCTDGEFVFDLYDASDYELWETLYGDYTAERCKEKGKFWMGGTNYYANVVDKDSVASKEIFSITEKYALKLIEDTIADEMESFFVKYLDINISNEKIPAERKRGYRNCIYFINKVFCGTIDFDGYTKANFKEYRELLSIKYKWIASSDDGAYEAESEKTFDTQKECYEDMRNAVLEKMKWNTEYDEDFEDSVSIGYKVSFNRDMIVHTSYSGVYTYTIQEIER